MATIESSLPLGQRQRLGTQIEMGSLRPHTRQLSTFGIGATIGAGILFVLSEAAPVTAPDLPRGFRVPLYPLVQLGSIAGCLWIIQDLRAVTIYVFVGWSAVALAWYLFYGRHRAVLGRGDTAAAQTETKS